MPTLIVLPLDELVLQPVNARGASAPALVKRSPALPALRSISRRVIDWGDDSVERFFTVGPRGVGAPSPPERSDESWSGTKARPAPCPAGTAPPRPLRRRDFEVRSLRDWAYACPQGR